LLKTKKRVRLETQHLQGEVDDDSHKIDHVFEPKEMQEMLAHLKRLKMDLALEQKDGDLLEFQEDADLGLLLELETSHKGLLFLGEQKR
jgi:hypothetical protein